MYIVDQLKLEQRIAFEYAKRRINLFISGAAGVGKSFLIDALKQCIDNIVCIAPSGMSALNIAGETASSFFGIPIIYYDISSVSRLKKGEKSKLQQVETILIDEVSMLRGDHLDIIDQKMRKAKGFDKPFGGAQVIIVGDLAQLEPVLKRTDDNYPYLMDLYDLGSKQNQSLYSFYSKVWKELDLTPVILSESLRHSEHEYIAALRNIRLGHNLDKSLKHINQRAFHQAPPHVIRLVNTNNLANQWNEIQLSNIKKPSRRYLATTSGVFKVPDSQLPSPKILELKIGCRVVITANSNNLLKSYFNGDMGIVIEMNEDNIGVELDRGKVVTISPKTWESMSYGKNLKLIKSGKYTQMPLKLSYAVTIHKCQGMTLESAVLDLKGGCFSAGSTYVGLSRVKEFKNLYLENELTTSDIITNYDAVEYTKRISLEALARRQKDIEMFGLEHMLSKEQSATESSHGSNNNDDELKELTLLECLVSESWDQNKNLRQTLINLEKKGVSLFSDFCSKNRMISSGFIYKEKVYNSKDVIDMPLGEWLILHDVILYLDINDSHVLSVLKTNKETSEKLLADVN